MVSARVALALFELAFLGPCAYAYVAAVVQHTVVLETSAEATVTSNLALYSTAAAGAKAASAQIVTFPEFGLGMPTDNCTTPEETTSSLFCEPVSVPIGTVLCGNSSHSSTPIQLNASCMAQVNKLWVGINTCERTALGAYNTELIFSPNGSLAAVYRKNHPFFTVRRGLGLTERVDLWMSARPSQ